MLPPDTPTTSQPARTMYRFASLACLFLLALLAPRLVLAGGTPGGPSHPARHVAVAVGASTDGHHVSPAVGVDGIYRFSFWHGRLGIAAVADVVLAAHPHGLAGAGLVVYPYAGLRVLVAPAVSFTDGHGTGALRAGLGYDVHVGAFSVTPSVALDRSHGTTIRTAGVALGFSF